MDPDGAIEPFQVTVFVATVATAVPADAVASTSVNDAGKTSCSSLPALSACAPGPPLLRVIVYVTTLPGMKAPLTVFVPLTAAPATVAPVTVVVVVALSFAGVGSIAGVVTNAVSDRIVPLATDDETLTTIVNTAEVTPSVAALHVIAPPAPGAGVVHTHPAGDASDTKVVPPGNVSVSCTPIAAAGPAFAIVIV